MTLARQSVIKSHKKDTLQEDHKLKLVNKNSKTTTEFDNIIGSAAISCRQQQLWASRVQHSKMSRRHQ